MINGSATSAITPSRGTQPGNRIVQSLQVCDRPGNCRRYADSELKAVMPKTKFKVVN
ncbi:hypothetical protein [Hydrocarboniphaga sp.]|uniref:hypothetical protein n=1 Tax=Hydrocarboniphaga sp. TaxID=2033016 RepID=UPI003D1180B0